MRKNKAKNTKQLIKNQMFVKFGEKMYNKVNDQACGDLRWKLQQSLTEPLGWRSVGRIQRCLKTHLKKSIGRTINE
jgi:hypothetical protein